MKRFWDKVEKTATCWNWTASRRPNGYGQFGVGRGTPQYAHRFSWALANGPVPDGMHVLHRCDNRRCVNPAHLFLGDNQANVDDKMAKGRHRWGTRRGEDSSQAKLTKREVLAIRLLCSRFTRIQAPIARALGVSKSLVGAVVNRGCWGHV